MLSSVIIFGEDGYFDNMSIRNAYSAWAPTYDSVENPTRDLDAVATRAVLAGTHWGTILELGCGTGKNTSFLAQIGDQVRALDFSPGMLAQAQAKIAAPNVTFAAADITQPWPCAGGSVDLVVVNLVLEHIADLDFIFAEAARCLRPGGHFFICELHPFRQYEGTQANFAVGDATVVIPAYVHHISDFLASANSHGFALARLDEWWRQPDRVRPPLLVSFLFHGRA